MLTDTQIKKAVKGNADAILDVDSLGRGAGALKLRIRVGTAGNAATWVVAWGSGKQRATKQIGTYPDMSLADARAIYTNDIGPIIRAGKDPRVTTATVEKPTVERMFQGYVAHMKAQGRESADEVERQLLNAAENAADGLGRHRLVATIDASDVVDYLAGFHRRGTRGAADKARSYIQSAFNWALKSANDYTVQERQDWGLKLNPAAVVARDLGAVGRRDRNLSADEIRTLWDAAAPGKNGFTLETAAVIRLIIGTGQRVQEVLRLDGAELDLAARVWRMPVEKTKTKVRPHMVPLPSQVIDILGELVAANGAGPLFPARKGAKRDRMDHRSIMQAIDRWVALPDVTADRFQTRDLRRTWKSRAGDGAKIDRETRDLIQQHAKSDTGSKHYDIADYLPQMRAAMDKWDAWLDSILVDQVAEPEALAA